MREDAATHALEEVHAVGGTERVAEAEVVRGKREGAREAAVTQELVEDVVGEA